MTTINWNTDSLEVIRAKQQLESHKEYLKEIEGKGYTRAEAYTVGCITKLTKYISGK